jgi:hypothetical protein
MNFNLHPNMIVDHSTVVITAGEGLSGGGDINSSRTIDLDIDQLKDSTALTSEDYVLLFDVSVGAHRKTTFKNFQRSLLPNPTEEDPQNIHALNALVQRQAKRIIKLEKEHTSMKSKLGRLENAMALFILNETGEEENEDENVAN